MGLVALRPVEFSWTKDWTCVSLTHSGLLNTELLGKPQWWLILYVNMIELRDAQIAGKTSFLGISVRVSLEEMRVWIARLSRDNLHQWFWWCHSIHWGPEQKKKAEEGQICSLCLCWDIHLLPISDICASGTQAFGLWVNYTTSFPGSPACTEQIMGLLNLRNNVSQFL